MSTCEPAVVAQDLPVPESLLAPLLDDAAATLAGLGAVDAPAVLRALAGFDKRGLNSGPARQQLRRAFDLDEGFRDQVLARFLERAEVRSAQDAWDVDHALRRVEDAAERSDLPLLASMLYATQPPGWAFGLGVVCAAFDRKRAEKERDDDAKATTLRLNAVDEARRRAEDARDVARGEAARFEEQLREERTSRREREARAARDVAEAERRRQDAEAEADKARAAAVEAEARLGREADRARDAETRLRAMRRDTETRSRVPDAAPEPASRADLDALAALSEEARRLAGALERVTRRVRTSASSDSAARAGSETSREPVSRRKQAPCPPGMHADSAEALDAMLRTRGVVLIVDGYNVSMAGWGSVPPADQRECLVSALARLHLRLRCDVVTVFDGSDVEGVAPVRKPGVRVVFSEHGEEADPVVVREVARLGNEIPVVVASSDQWVRVHAEQEGATGVSSAVLLEVLRR